MKKMKENYIILFSLGCILLISTTFIFFYFTDRSIIVITTAMRPIVIIYSIGVLSLFLSRFYTPDKLLKLFDDNSMDVYYVHLLVLMIFNKSLEVIGFDSTSFIVSIILIILTAVTSIIFAISRKYVFKRIFIFFRTRVTTK